MSAERARWCPSCNRLIDDEDPSDEVPEDRCPICGSQLADADADADFEEEHPKAPWHFKVLVIGTIGYLIYRLIWFIGWLSHHA